MLIIPASQTLWPLTRKELNFYLTSRPKEPTWIPEILSSLELLGKSHMLSPLETSTVPTAKEITEMDASMTQEPTPMLPNSSPVAWRSIFNNTTKVSLRPSKKLILESLWWVFYSQEDLFLLMNWFPFLILSLLLGCPEPQEVKVLLMQLLEIMPWSQSQVQRRTHFRSIGPKIRY